MSSLVFLNALAYAGIGLVVSSLFYVGILLLRKSSTVSGLAAMVNESGARERLRDGRLRPAKTRVKGTLILLVDCFIAICIARDLQHV